MGMFRYNPYSIPIEIAHTSSRLARPLFSFTFEQEKFLSEYKRKKWSGYTRLAHTYTIYEP